ncbi:MAG: hypothetical protein R2795_13820 [Saprospiraceae bacterium]
MSNITNGGNQYTVDFDDPSIPDITTATNIPVNGVVMLPIPNTLATATYTGSITYLNSTTGCSETSPMSFVVNALPTINPPTTSVCIGQTTSVTGLHGCSNKSIHL